VKKDELSQFTPKDHLTIDKNTICLSHQKARIAHFEKMQIAYFKVQLTDKYFSPFLHLFNRVFVPRKNSRNKFMKKLAFRDLRTNLSFTIVNVYGAIKVS
jgi:hypothetical protein